MKRKHLPPKSLISSPFWQNIQTMFTPKKNSLRRFGKWNLSVTLQPLPYTSKKYAKRSKKTPQSQNILKRSGASDIVSASDPFRILDIICISNCLSGIGSQLRLYAIVLFMMQFFFQPAQPFCGLRLLFFQTLFQLHTASLQFL